MVFPVAAWPNHGTQEIIIVGSDGQVYSLPMLEGGKLVSTEWKRLGPPLPGSKAMADRQADAASSSERAQ